MFSRLFVVCAGLLLIAGIIATVDPNRGKETSQPQVASEGL